MFELKFPFSTIIIPLAWVPKMMSCESAYTNTMKDFHIFLFRDIINYGFQVFGRQSALSCLEKKATLPIKIVASPTSHCSYHIVSHV